MRADYERDGRRWVTIDGVEYEAGEVAWLYVTGQWPKGGVEYIDGNPLNCRFANLREKGLPAKAAA